MSEVSVLSCATLGGTRSFVSVARAMALWGALSREPERCVPLVT
jgi:hypothetical protein